MQRKKKTFTIGEREGFLLKGKPFLEFLKSPTQMLTYDENTKKNAKLDNPKPALCSFNAEHFLLHFIYLLRWLQDKVFFL